jgi:DNA-binding CsgD family transcriptional regulator
LAQELLSHGGRDEGRELLVDCWTAAHDMGAGGLERRALRLATRTRVPLPESASSEGPLSRLTPREREVLERLATGATNKAIADELVISEKTVSVHVSDLLAELGVEKRGPTPPSPENWCPSRVTRNQVWTSQTFRPPPAAPQNRHAVTSPVVAESAVHQQSARLQRHGFQSLDCRHASLPLPVRSRPASTTASAHETFPHQPRPMSRSPARRRGRLDPVLSAVTWRKDCEDRLRSLMVMGCGLVAAGVTPGMTGVDALVRPVHSRLPAPARLEELA